MIVPIAILTATLLLVAILGRAYLVAAKSRQREARKLEGSLESSVSGASEAPDAYDPAHRRIFASTQAETPMARARASSVENMAGQRPPNKANGA